MVVDVLAPGRTVTPAETRGIPDRPRRMATPKTAPGREKKAEAR
jgi:hypothetical protein